MLTIGIDFGYQTVKIAGINHGLFGPRLVATKEMPIPVQTITKQGLTHIPELMTAVQKGLQTAAPHPIHGHKVFSAMPASLVLTKRLELPPMPDRELAQSITLEAEQSFPVPIDELVIDWLVIDQSGPPTKPNQPRPSVVFLMGAPRRLVESLISLFDQLGLDLQALEIKPIANARAVTVPHDLNRYLLLDLGAVETSLVVIDHGRVSHVASVPIGANSLTHQTKAPAKVAPVDLTQLLPPTLVTTKSPVAKKITQTDHKAALAVSLKPLVAEIEQITKFASQHLGGPPINELRLCGGGAQTTGLASALASATGLVTALANPLAALPQTRHQPHLSLGLTTAIGLALRKENV